MGILEDVGVIEGGNVSEKQFKKYVDDVKKMMQSGKGIFPPGLVCSQPVQPVSGVNMIDLSNKDIFPEFHRIWRPRYENMVKSLDVPGDFQLAKNGLLPFIDPTAVAKVIGAEPPPLDLPGALALMLSGPPMGTPAFIALHFPTLSADIQALTKLLSPGSDFLKILIPSIPIPPIPTLPNPLLFKFGYTEQFNFETALALAPIKTHLKMMIPALAVAELPGIIAKLVQGDVVGGLIQFVCKQVGGDHPKPMSTSSLEIAAQQTLIQHQVKYQALTFVGQQVGSGVVTQGLASSPFTLGGLEILPPKEEAPVDVTISIDGLSSRRQVMKKKIIEVLGDAPNGKAEYPSEKWSRIAPLYSPAKVGEITDWNAAWDAYE
jgi:hypothetical protein